MRETILLVDDDLFLLEIMKTVLEAGTGAQILSFNQPEEAYSEVIRRNGDIQFIITDFHMPGLSGLELLMRIAKTYPGIPACIASGDSEQVREKTSLYPILDKGSTSFITSLVQLANELLDEKRKPGFEFHGHEHKHPSRQRMLVF